MSVTSTSGTQPVTQAAFQQLQLAQARQFAERAAQNARSLQASANSAQAAADQAQENAKSLSVDASQAHDVALQAARNVQSTESANQIGPQVLGTITQAAQTPAVAVPAPTPSSTPAPAQPTVNTQGQTIGTVINVTA
ncbi:MAG TPA: hypothetical protein VFW59_08445 [Gallionella sp.]|nr:hypothetical protein [Gallionella sp.]